MTDREPEETASEAERAEAEALTRALERGHGDAPDDALGAAALLRYSEDRDALDADREAAILADVLGAAPPRKESHRVPVLRWLVPALGLGALSAAALFLTVRPTQGALPAPTAALLEAQADAAAGTPEGPQDLNRQMRSYRNSLYASLSDRYGR